MDITEAQIGDFLMARALRELDFAHEVLDKAQGDKDYFREKNAAKLFGYYQAECELIKHYVELKLYYPQTAIALEEQKPYLIGLWKDAADTLGTILRESGAM